MSDSKTFLSKQIGWMRGERNARYAMVIEKDGTISYAETDAKPGVVEVCPKLSRPMRRHSLIKIRARALKLSWQGCKNRGIGCVMYQSYNICIHPSTPACSQIVGDDGLRDFSQATFAEDKPTQRGKTAHCCIFGSL